MNKSPTPQKNIPPLYRHSFLSPLALHCTEKNVNQIKQHIIIAARLAQWDKRRSAEREVTGSSPGRTNTQGL